ncbi:MAG: cytochrome c [Bacteroidales bacterium]|nr:cytochrome c [Bacteroidales bacterium]MCF8402833.1 cytochrome c [Bacteroidales bacterium]
MKTILLIVGILMATSLWADEGKDIFQIKCAACHTVGNGRLVGPDLQGITEKRNQDWLIAFIKSSTAMIKSGDADAVAISKEYNGLLMPDNPYSDAQILSVLSFIEQGGTSDENQVSATADILSNTTPNNIESGALLFSGEKRFTNGGAACTSCHSVKDERIFSGGTLAKNLTETWDIMGSSGVATIIRSSPFPVMNMAYSKHSLTEEEVIDLTAYLKSVSQERYYQRSSDFSIAFAIFGLVFFTLIFMVTIALYFKRKSYPVNYDILNRPSKVVN